MMCQIKNKLPIEGYSNISSNILPTIFIMYTHL